MDHVIIFKVQIKYGVSAEKKYQIDKKFFFQITNVLNQITNFTSFLLKNIFLKKISIWYFFPALTPYIQLIDSNQELRDETSNNEKKIRSIMKELERCYQTITRQDNTIIAQEEKINSLKFQISDLRKRLYVLQQDKKFKEKASSVSDIRII